MFSFTSISDIQHFNTTIYCTTKTTAAVDINPIVESLNKNENVVTTHGLNSFIDEMKNAGIKIQYIPRGCTIQASDSREIF